MKRIILLTLAGIAGLIATVNAQTKKDSTAITELKIGKQRVLVIEENGNKTSIAITPDTDYKKILKDVFTFTDSVAETIEKAINTTNDDTVEVKVFPTHNDTLQPMAKQGKDTAETYFDTVEVKIGKIKLVTIDTDKKTSVRIYKEGETQADKTQNTSKNNKKGQIVEHPILEKQTEKDEKTSRDDFEGKWFGVEIGLNTLYTNNGFYMPSSYDKMDLNYGKSWFFNLNMVHKSIAFTKNTGLVTGLGLEFRNYRFISRNLVLNQEDTLSFTIDTQYNYVKSKLQTTHLRVPLFFEIYLPEKNEFHLMFGVIGNLMIGAHSKNVYYDEKNDKRISKHYNIHYLNFLNYSLSVRIGMENISLFIDYGMLPIFRPNNHLDTHPVNIGVCFLL